MNTDLVLAAVIFSLLVYIAWREYNHTTHLQSLERRLQGPNVLPPEEKPTERQEMRIERPKAIDLDMARNIPAVTDKLKAAGVTFTAQGPSYAKTTK